MRKTKKQKIIDKYWENEVMAPWDEALLKTNDALLSEFADGTLNESGLSLLNMRGYLDQLLSMCSSDEQREAVWLDFFMAEYAKSLIERGVPCSREEVEVAANNVQLLASVVARSH